MSDSAKFEAAVLGLGIVGSRAFACLREAGWPVRSWNRTPKGLPDEMGSPEVAVAGATAISLYLKDAPAVREIFSQIEDSLKSGQTILNHSTLDLETTLWLAERCKSAGCDFLDVPFTGSKDAAGAGNLLYYTGGDPAQIERFADYLAVTSRASVHCGDIGAATVVKLATNLISACSVQAMAEALALVTRQGVAAERFVEAVSQNASASKLSEMKLSAMTSGNFETHFSLANMAKDSRYMLALAAASGVETPAIAAVSRRMGELESAGLGELDFCAVAKPYRQEA